jgi:predicted secreted hydrolase
VRGARVAWIGAVGLLLAALGAWALSSPAERPRVRARLSLAATLGGEAAAGYARAVAARPLAFPVDHGPHPEYRTEWWYFTGNLETAAGRRFGYQLTFFRQALAPDVPRRASAWATNQVYMAHFALTDAAGDRFHAFERLGRGAVGLAGARADPLRVWLDDWTAAGAGDGLSLRAAEADVALELALTPIKPITLHGDRGLSRKSAEAGNASYYYSLTRLESRGTITIGSTAFPVRGLSWMDREWSTSALGPDQVGWDWFALQLADGRDLMVYRLRRRDGSVDPFSSGTLVAADGTAHRLARDDVVIEVRDTWRSPRDGTRYPARWRLRVPRARLDLDVRPLLADQELELTFRYWEGAVVARAADGDARVLGRGYVELTGYAADDPAAGSSRRDGAPAGGDGGARRRGRSRLRAAAAPAAVQSGDRRIEPGRSPRAPHPEHPRTTSPGSPRPAPRRPAGRRGPPAPACRPRGLRI